MFNRRELIKTGLGSLAGLSTLSLSNKPIQAKSCIPNDRSNNIAVIISDKEQSEALHNFAQQLAQHITNTINTIDNIEKFPLTSLPKNIKQHSIYYGETIPNIKLMSYNDYCLILGKPAQ